MGDRVAAAEELTQARDNLRELQEAGRATEADVQRVKDAEDAYTEASKDFSEQE